MAFVLSSMTCLQFAKAERQYVTLEMIIPFVGLRLLTPTTYTFVLNLYILPKLRDSR